MTSNTKHEEWEWQELTWPDTLTPDAVHATLEHLAASSTLGPIVLEARATKTGLRWLIAAKPTRIDTVLDGLRAHLTVRAHTPRRNRHEVQHAVDLRVTGTDLSLEAPKITASIRGLYGHCRASTARKKSSCRSCSVAATRRPYAPKNRLVRGSVCLLSRHELARRRNGVTVSTASLSACASASPEQPLRGRGSLSVT